MNMSYAYWIKYLKILAKSLDRYRLLEQSCLNVNHSEWLEGRRSIRSLYRSKRFVSHVNVFGRILNWVPNHGSLDSLAIIDVEYIRYYADFPETF